jgi:hypothetical protein
VGHQEPQERPELPEPQDIQETNIERYLMALSTMHW